MYMNKDNEIKTIWKKLEEAHVSGLVKRAIDIPSCLKMFCTYKSQNEYCGIAFSFSQEIKVDISPFSSLSEIEVSLFKDKSFPDSKFLLVQLLNRGDRVRKLVISQMRKWQDLFSKRMKNTLSIQEQQGLFGELLFLRKLICSPMDKVRSVMSWVGPNMAPQDFQSKSWAVEVKTITANKYPNVSINGELQLDETPIDKLFLYNLAVEIVPVDGKNLPELVGELRDSLSQDANALNLFENKLINKMRAKKTELYYKERRYYIRKENYYLVQGEFPRIKKDDLLLGISDVRYTITLAVPTENIIEERNVLNTIQSYERNQ